MATRAQAADDVDMFRIVRVLLVIPLMVVAPLLAPPGTAWAHEGEESEKSADLVRQGIALLVNKPDDLAAVREKLGDAREATDKTGVDLALVGEADTALAAGDVHKGRALMERAIGAQPHLGATEPAPIRETSPGSMPMASPMTSAPMRMARGAEPGSGQVISDPLEVRPRLDGGDWALLWSFLVVGLVGVWLGLRFRPGRPKAA